MDRQLIMKRVQSVFQDVFDDPSLVIGEETHAGMIGDWDSLAHVNLVSAVELDLGVSFPLAELEALRNVGDMIDLIEKKLPAV